MTLAVSITRHFSQYGPGVSDDSDLDLNDGTTYVVVSKGVDPGAVVHRRTTAQSKYVPGRALIAAVKDISEGRLRLLVQSTTSEGLQDALATLYAAFEQYTYTLTVDLDGWAEGWACEAADWAPDNSDGLDEFQLLQFFQVMRFSFPRNPVPLEVVGGS